MPSTHSYDRVYIETRRIQSHTRHPANPKLGKWVDHRWQNKKRLDASHPKPYITAERVAQLEALGFKWSPTVGGAAGRPVSETGWDAMRDRLAAFEAEHGHCRVSQRHATDPKLGKWVGNQRQAKKRLDAGLPSPRTTPGAGGPAGGARVPVEPR